MTVRAFLDELRRRVDSVLPDDQDSEMTLANLGDISIELSRLAAEHRTEIRQPTSPIEEGG